MNLRRAAVVLRPREVAEQLDLGCRVCMTIAFGIFARLSAVLLLPVFVGCLVLHHGLGWPWLVLWVVAIVLSNVLQGAFTIAMGRLLFSESLSARQVLSLFGRRFFAYVWMLVLSAGAWALTFGILAPRLVFVHEANLLEGAAGMAAIGRSGRFIQGRGGASFSVLIALLLTQIGFVITAELLGHGIVSEVLQLGKPFGALVDDGGSAYALGGFLLSVPYVASARFLSYIDGRTRADGWDIQVRFMAIAATHTEGKAAA